MFISGAGVRTGASKPYWEALRRGERAVLESGMESVCIEPTLVYGPHDRGINRILAFARRWRLVPLVGSGAETHQPVFVDDVADVVRRAVALGAPQGAFEIGGPDRVTMTGLIELTMSLAGVHGRIVHLPTWFARVGGHTLRRFPGELLSPAAIDFILEDFVADLEPITTAFGVAPTPLRQGLSYLATR